VIPGARQPDDNGNAARDGGGESGKIAGKQ
jgi:hypothetical protein